jgi:hypothetical protein
VLLHETGKNGREAYRLNSRVDYEIAVPAGATVRVESMSGNIEVTGLTGPLTAKSFGGFVDVSWPATQGAEVSLSSFSGEVYTNQKLALDKGNNDAPMGHRVSGKLGSSGPAVTLESFGGDVYFRKQD